MPFYEALRKALSTYEAFVHEAGQPASKKDLSQMEDRLGYSPPPAYIDFLLSFNGARLFHEQIVLFATNDSQFAPVSNHHTRIGEMPIGSLWMDVQGFIRIVDENQPDPIIIGSNLELFLEATFSREGLLYDEHGEFLEVFDEEGELFPEIREKQIKLGRKKDPRSSMYLLEEAEWLLSQHQTEQAIALLVQAITIDPQAGPCLELLASLQQEQYQPETAEHLFEQAAQAALDQNLKASRFLQAAQIAPFERQKNYIQMAWMHAPQYATLLENQIQQRLQVEPQEAQNRYDSLKLLLSFIPQEMQEKTKQVQENIKSIESKLRIRSSFKIL